ncbi:hypothetical protein AFK24_25700 [Pseudomonas syringae]|uniref:Major facilitator superfamily (MFS) profile domain-containing protein n=1 Tax=Pseudomonas syringae TaxID=317 RepID=A0A1C7Z0F1_PSESX|nr:MFS transporter [Pseudomonas syringae]OCR22487.1 hypothetical protein AFK24_25700 [Pseudomonas syringae]
MTDSTNAQESPLDNSVSRKKTLFAACAAHAIHDGLSDLVYVFLPIWQEMFALSYVWLSVLRSCYSLTLAALQIPASLLATRIKPQTLLVIATLVTGIGWLIAGLAGSAMGLGAALVISGIGASFQHPIASAMVTRAFGQDRKRPLGLYNFSGDLGKALLPASAALLLTYTSYRSSITLCAAIGLFAALLIWSLLRKGRARADDQLIDGKFAMKGTDAHINPRAFNTLLTTAVLDSAVRMGFLTFLPFIIKANGGSLAQTGFALTLVFLGGAVGKFVCGWMANSLGTVRTVVVTELATALLIGVVLFSPLSIGLLALPLLGAVLNGTSSVLYGSVPDVVNSQKLEKAFSVFYTGTIGSGALAPILYSFIGDNLGLTTATTLVAVTAVIALIPVVLYSLVSPGAFHPTEA